MRGQQEYPIHSLFHVSKSSQIFRDACKQQTAALFDFDSVAAYVSETIE